MSFNIYPAIDLRQGHVVRLQYGDPNRQTTFSQDPMAVARQWRDAGAAWLHVVNLDGAFDEAGAANWALLPQLAALGPLIQFGGGIRTMTDVTRALTMGVSRVVLGTVAVEVPELVAVAVDQFGAARIAVGIDVRDNRVKTRGWKMDTPVTPVALGRQMRQLGIQIVIFTDIGRDGVLTGVNAEATARLARETGVQVIASGGVSSLEDIRHCYALADQGVAGVIVGRALYDGQVDLRQALEEVGQE